MSDRDYSRKRGHKPLRETGHDFLEREISIEPPSYPVKPARRVQEDSTESQNKFEDLIGRAKRKVDKESQELRKSTSSEATSYERMMRKKEKDTSKMTNEDLMGEIERLKKVEEVLNHRLAIRQDAFIRREQQLKRRERDLMKKLLEATTFKHGRQEVDFTAQIRSLREQKSHISRRIDLMKGEKDQLVKEKEADIQMRVEDLKKQYEKKLDIVRSKSFSSQREFFEKTRKLKKCLVDIRKKAEDLDRRNMQLEEENMRLKIEFKAQQTSEGKWARKNAKYKRDNERLRSLVQEMEKHLEEKSQVLEIGNNEISSLRRNLQEMKISKHSQVLSDSEFVEKLRRQMEQERRNMRVLKKSYVNILSERTELEIFLKQCIEDSRRKLKMIQGGSSMVEFEERDRDTVVKILFSKEKVLNMLFEKTFPYKRNTFQATTSTMRPNSNRV